MMRWWKEHFQTDFYNAWGMTESVSGTSARRVAVRADLNLTVEEQFERNVAVTPGLPLPYNQIRLCDPDDFSKELPQDGKAFGELMIKGPTVTGRYFEMPEAGDKFYQGWLATGDICKVA